MKISFCPFFIVIFLSSMAFAEQINSTSYKNDIVVTTGGENSSSSNYRIGTAVGIITKIINSTSYINKLGFFHTWLLAVNQPCSDNNQCETGYCCSSICSSSACSTPSPEPEPTPSSGGPSGGGGGGGSAFYVCNQEWKCNEWSSCINEAQSRLCSLEKVPQHSQPSQCPSISNPLLTARRCNATEVEKESNTSSLFLVEPDVIKDRLRLKQNKSVEIIIKNVAGSAVDFSLEIENLAGFAKINETKFRLNAGQSKNVSLFLTAAELGSHFGSLEIASENLRKSVPIVFDVQTPQVLFDVKLDIPLQYKTLATGQDLRQQLTLLNIGTVQKANVLIAYFVKDRIGRAVYSSEERMNIDRQASFLKTIPLPKNLKPGTYLSSVEVSYGDSVAVSGEIFTVRAGIVQKNRALIGGIIITIMIVLIAYFLFIARTPRRKAPRR